MEERELRIDLVVGPIALAAAIKQLDLGEAFEFALHRTNRQPGSRLDLALVVVAHGIGEKKAEYFRAHARAK